jgi:hypothetical protein
VGTTGGAGMSEIDYILEILILSLRKHGDMPITTSHWISIIKMAKREKEQGAANYEGIFEKDNLWK